MDFQHDILSHRDRLFRLALGITLHTAEAEDVVQDTMLRAWERRDEWPAIQNIGAWLTQICRNLALDRRKRAHLEVLDTPSAADTTPQAPSAGSASLAVATSHPADDLDVRESVALLTNLIRQLPPPQDDIVRLRDIEGLSYREIAAELSLTDAQVRVYLHRARQRLREQYQRLQDYGL